MNIFQTNTYFTLGTHIGIPDERISIFLTFRGKSYSTWAGRTSFHLPS